MKRRDRRKERMYIRSELSAIRRVLEDAAAADLSELVSTPVRRRRQTLKIKVARQRLDRLHTAILLGKGRA